MFKRRDGELLVLLSHPGGPFWKNRDVGAWTIPKGELDIDEEPIAAARREFEEEMGTPPGEPLSPLGEITQKGGKRVIAFAIEGEFDVASLRSNLFEMEWPPRSGKMESFPEVDKAEWMTMQQARERILPSQIDLLERLVHLAR